MIFFKGKRLLLSFVSLNHLLNLGKTCCSGVLDENLVFFFFLHRCRPSAIPLSLSHKHTYTNTHTLNGRARYSKLYNRYMILITVALALAIMITITIKASILLTNLLHLLQLFTFLCIHIYTNVVKDTQSETHSHLYICIYIYKYT